MNVGLILLIILIVVIGYFITIYNGFISLNVRIDSSLSDIDVLLKKRYNLIPALIETVKGYKDYESSTLQKIVEARQLGLNAKSVEEKAKANSILSSALKGFFALAESYPDLIIAKKFNFTKRDYFELDESKKLQVIQMPKVDFN